MTIKKCLRKNGFTVQDSIIKGINIIGEKDEKTYAFNSVLLFKSLDFAAETTMKRAFGELLLFQYEYDHLMVIVPNEQIPKESIDLAISLGIGILFIDEKGNSKFLVEIEETPRSVDKTLSPSFEFHIWNLLNPCLSKVVKKSFEVSHYTEAVSNGIKALNNRVKEIVKLNVGYELDGDKLMRHAFSSNKPVIVLGDLQTETGRNIQDGYRDLFAGAIRGIRNPIAHDLIKLEKDECIHILFLISHLWNKLDEVIL